MKRFFFHLSGPAGIERDEEGIVCDNVEHAYLRACEALPDMAAEMLRARKDPMAHSFLIANSRNQTLMTVPFDETVMHTRSARCVSREVGPLRSLRETDARILRQRSLVSRLESRGQDAQLARKLLATLEEVRITQRRAVLQR